MAKIIVCDVCKTRHDKLTRAVCHINAKGHKDLKIDLCRVHAFEVERKFPNVTTEYVQFIYKMVHGTELSDENTEIMLRNRR